MKEVHFSMPKPMVIGWQPDQSTTGGLSGLGLHGTLSDVGFHDMAANLYEAVYGQWRCVFPLY